MTVIAAFLGTQTLGDFIMYHLVAASVARAIPGSRLFAVYRDDRPYKAPLCRYNPRLERALALPDDPAVVCPVDGLAGLGAADGDPWAAAGLPPADLLLTPSMLNIGGCLWPPPALYIPDAEAADGAARLTARGLDPDRWFAALHMRENLYEHRFGVDARRSVDPSTYLPMIRDLLARGGQVVRLGDPSMAPLPDLPGFIDLSRTGTFAEQAWAVSRARFFLGTDTGPTQLACAFKTPAATTNAMGIGVWNDGDLVALKTFVLSTGRKLTRDALLDMTDTGMQVIYPKDEMDVVDNLPDDLAAVGRHMLDRTEDCPAWRVPAPDPAAGEPLALPLPWHHVLDRADLTMWG
ncbi:MAG: TIGR04372 family glycosyltransferase [Rhodobacterales bacterium]|nr:TIGR04372 family glycosyltransferase [Rhodobacterales bacterium]